MRKQILKYIEQIKQDKKITIYYLGTFYLLPRRQGKLSGIGEGKDIKYRYRIKFKPSVWLKDTLCK